MKLFDKFSYSEEEEKKKTPYLLKLLHFNSQTPKPLTTLELNSSILTQLRRRCCHGSLLHHLPPSSSLSLPFVLTFIVHGIFFSQLLYTESQQSL